MPEWGSFKGFLRENQFTPHIQSLCFVWTWAVSTQLWTEDFRMENVWVLGLMLSFCQSITYLMITFPPQSILFWVPAAVFQGYCKPCCTKYCSKRNSPELLEKKSETLQVLLTDLVVIGCITYHWVNCYCLSLAKHFSMGLNQSMATSMLGYTRLQ